MTVTFLFFESLSCALTADGWVDCEEAFWSGIWLSVFVVALTVGEFASMALHSLRPPVVTYADLAGARVEPRVAVRGALHLAAMAVAMYMFSSLGVARSEETSPARSEETSSAWSSEWLDFYLGCFGFFAIITGYLVELLRPVQVTQGWAGWSCQRLRGGGFRRAIGGSAPGKFRGA